VQQEDRLATSKDLGLTWTLVGDILTRALPNVQDYSGPDFEAGPADFDFYADTRGGYFYVTSWNSFTPKQGKLNGFTMYSEVARCAIADKMAPGKWFKFRDGAWTEPGLGGKASRLGFDRRGIYGNTIYSTYLEKYLRIGIHIGVKDNRACPATDSMIARSASRHAPIWPSRIGCPWRDCSMSPQTRSSASP